MLQLADDVVIHLILPYLTSREQWPLRQVSRHFQRLAELTIHYHPGKDLREAFEYFTRHNHADTLQWLLNTRVDLSSGGDLVLFWACRTRRGSLVKQLLLDDQVRQQCNSTMLNAACLGGDLEILKSVQSIVPTSPSRLADMLGFASRNGHLTIIEHLLATEPKIRDRPSGGLEPAVAAGQVAVVRRLLEVLPRDDSYQLLLETAAAGGHLELFKKLTANYTYISWGGDVLLRAVRNNQRVIVDRLLTIYQVSPAYQNQQPLCLACRRGHLAIVNQLLEYDQVKPDVNYQKPLHLAVRSRQVKVVKRLLQDARVNPQVDDYTILRDAAAGGDVQILTHLVSGQIPPAGILTDLLILASEYGHLPVMELILSWGIELSNSSLLARSFGNG